MTEGQMRPIRAAQYLRMSTEHQRYSPDNQAAAIEAYAKARGYEIVRTYLDAGKSGLTLQHRNGLKTLLADVIGGTAEVDAILVLDVSRWGRFQDTDQSAHYEFLCRQAGVAVHYCAEPFDNDQSPTASIMKHVKRVMAAEFSRELSEKIRRGRRRLAGLGYKQSTVTSFAINRLLVGPAGEPKGVLGPGQQKAVADDRVLIARGSEDEVRAVKTIFRMFVKDHQTIRVIAAHLTESGAPLYGGQPWNTVRVRTVLRNPLYAGTYVFGKTQRILRGCRTRLPPEIWTKTEVLAPIVPKVTFGLAQQKLDAHRPGQLYDEEAMLHHLRRILKKHGYLSEKLIKDSPGLASPTIYRRKFGSLGRAYAMVGFWTDDKAGRYLARSFSKSDVIVELEKLLELYGFLTGRLLDESRTAPSPSTVIHHFGTLEQAYRAAGYHCTRASQIRLAERLKACRFYDRFETDQEGARAALAMVEDFSCDDLARKLSEFAELHGSATFEGVNAARGFPSTSVFIRAFGSFSAAQRAAGLKPGRYSDAEHLERLSEVYRRHGKITSIIVDRDPGCSMYATYQARFGSLAKACEAAGIPFKLRVQRARKARSSVDSMPVLQRTPGDGDA